MKYKVIHGFSDMSDNGYVYKAGDEYPRLGANTTPVRIAELSSSTNRIGEPLIQEAKAEKPKRKKKE